MVLRTNPSTIELITLEVSSNGFLLTKISKISISSKESNSLNESISSLESSAKLFSTKGIKIASNSQSPRLHCHNIFFSNSFKVIPL